MAALENVSTDDLHQILAEVEGKDATQRVMAAINYLEDDDWALVQQSIRATTDDVEKRKEIERSKRATQERIDNGYDHGRDTHSNEDGEFGGRSVISRPSPQLPCSHT